MKSWDLLRAMDLMDEELVLDAGNTGPGRKNPLRRLPVLVAAVLLTGMLVLSAIAAPDGAGWFLTFFSGRAPDSLTAGQQNYIREATVNLGQVQTNNGYTIALESAITDGRKSYFRFLLTVPEGTVLDADWYGDLRGSVIINENGENYIEGQDFSMGSMIWTHQKVDGSDNKVTLLYETEAFHEGQQRELWGHVWTFYIYGLRCGYRDDEYGMRYETLTEGLWTYEIRFPEACQREIEFVSEPVTVMAALGVGARMDPEKGIISMTEKAEPVELISFTLRSLTADLSFRYSERDRINGDFGDIYVVMKNGEKVLLTPFGGAPNYLTYGFETPIVLEEVAYIQFADGTVLQAP